MDEDGLTRREASGLEQKDEILFGRGACHILAVAFNRDPRWASWDLVRVEVSGSPREGDISGAFHVYVRKNGQILDAKGKQSEAAYLSWLNDHLIALSQKAEYRPAVILGPKPVSADELLAKHHRDRVCRAWMNEWDLFTGDRFVHEAMRRAEKGLQIWSGQGALF